MILAVDTSSRWMSVALFDGVNVLNETVWHAPDYHTAQLAPMAEQVLQRSGLQATDLQALAVALGPGGYTGLRVGLAFIKGLAYAAHLPVVGVPSLDALVAAQVPPYVTATGAFPGLEKLWLAAFLQAGRSRFAVGWYRLLSGDPAQPLAKRFTQESAETLTLEAFLEEADRRATADESQIFVCGEFNQHDREVLVQRREGKAGQFLVASPAQSLRRPGFLAELAWARFQAGQLDDPSTIAPIYLR